MPSPGGSTSSAPKTPVEVTQPALSDPVGFVLAAFAPLANARKGREMAAYMRTTQPFLGINDPERRPVYKELCRLFAPRNASGYRATTLAIWHAGVHGDSDASVDSPDGPGAAGPARQPRRDSKMLPPEHTGPREVMYAAVAYAAHFSDHHSVEHLPLYKRLVSEGGWWDIGDWVSNRIVASVMLKERSRTAAVMRKWIHDEVLWVRRAAILSQMGHKEQTDQRLLFEFSLDRAEEEDFFIRKAIGWALRAYARTEPDAVRDFLAKNKKKLSTLTIREAGKHLNDPN